MADKETSPRWIYVTLAVALMTLASSRLHATPMLLLLLAAAMHTKLKRGGLLAVSVCVLVLGWTIFAMTNTIDQRTDIQETTTRIVLFYLENPGTFFSVLWNTLRNDGLQTFYHQSFIGILGWLNVPFRPHTYLYFSYALAVIAGLSIAFTVWQIEWRTRILLLVTSIMSTLIIFLALLVTWTPHPASVIVGVQGRYFLLPAIMLAYALTKKTTHRNSGQLTLVELGTFGFFCFSLAATFILVRDTYWPGTDY